MMLWIGGPSLADDLSSFRTSFPLPPCPSAPSAPGLSPDPEGPPLSLTPVLVLATPISLPVDCFTLPPIESGDNCLRSRNLILFWLCSSSFSTACDDSLLITDACNALASQFWEGQLQTSLKDSLVWFLFENTGSTFYGKGFKMLQFLEDNFCLPLISNTFTTLPVLFNTTQGDKEGLHEFCARFKGHVNAPSQSSVAIPLILQVMLFLQALHFCYQDLITQFTSKQKDQSSTTINSVVADTMFMEEFIVVGLKPKSGTLGAPPCTPAAARVVTDKNGKEHCSP
jgi:hypothetical protein